MKAELLYAVVVPSAFGLYWLARWSYVNHRVSRWRARHRG